MSTYETISLLIQVCSVMVAAFTIVVTLIIFFAKKK
ncbi:putative holin-like toxin [Bacillus sp. FJAT-22090]|nr:putative holin-like toxin [Bacillus sp. FJAT-22090]